MSDSRRPRIDDLCAEPDAAPPMPARPFAAPIFPASVYACEDTAQAEGLLAGEIEGYVYQRDGHPNADLLAEKGRRLHGADWAAVTSSGMAALALALLSQTRQGDHIVAADQLYGRSLGLLTSEAARFGVDCTLVDAGDIDAVAAVVTPRTRLLVVETIGNPLLRVADAARLAEVAQAAGALLLVDNTFATPALFRPLEHGADLVLESVSKMMNGHSDVMLGMLCGRRGTDERIAAAMSSWGLASSPFDCWLACRGLATLHLRVERACAGALAAAEFLAGHRTVERVDYPGLSGHADHALAQRQFEGRFGWMVTFHLAGGRPAADAFIRGANRLPFCPSLGETATTISHPQSTSHRGLSEQHRLALGIGGGTLRLSVGLESTAHIIAALEEGLAAA